MHEQQHLPAQGTVVEAAHNAAGDLVATASSSGVVQLWTPRKSGWSLLHTEKLAGAAQATQLQWAHPQHGQLLAVGTSTGQVAILQGGAASWSSVTQLQCGQGHSVSALAFAPHQHGLVLAAACSRRGGPAAGSTRPPRSSVQLWEAAGKSGSSRAPWTLVSSIELSDAAGTCHSLSWRNEATPGVPPMLLCGHDAAGSIWGYNTPTMAWQELASFPAPREAADAPAVSVHWAPALGRPYELIAASFGSRVGLFEVLPAAGGGGGNKQQQLEVVPLQTLVHPQPVWKLAFNSLGTTLACSLDGEAAIWLWMNMLDGPWAAVSKVVGGCAGAGGAGGAGGEADDSVMVD